VLVGRSRRYTLSHGSAGVSVLAVRHIATANIKDNAVKSWQDMGQFAENGRTDDV